MEFLVGWPGGDWQATVRLAVALVAAYLFLLWVASILWAYRDIRGRTRDPASQLVGIGIVAGLPLLGIPVYMVVRPRETLREAYDRQLEQEAILSDLHSVSTCAQCRRPVEPDWMICAFCSTSLKQPCRSCDRLLMNAWRHCPYCGVARERPQPAARLPVEEPPALDLDSGGLGERRRQAERAASRDRDDDEAEPEPVPARPRRNEGSR